MEPRQDKNYSLILSIDKIHVGKVDLSMPWSIQVDYVWLS